jgi:hypothetical protein
MKFAFIPGKTANHLIIIVKLKANQLLIISDLEDIFSSCDFQKVILILNTKSKQLFLVMVEFD